MNSRVFSFGCLGLLCITPSLAQAPNDKATGEVAMKAAIGAFKITSPGDRKAFGKVTMSFKGTLLIVGYEGAPIVVSGGLKTEYENKKRERIEYFGEGTITLDGKYRAIQYFGRNLDMNWAGNGIIRVYGEFDKTGLTGTYTIKGEKQRWWGTGGTTFSLPGRESSVGVPKVKIKGSGG